jgi:hypothetical protein
MSTPAAATAVSTAPDLGKRRIPAIAALASGSTEAAIAARSSIAAGFR